MPATATPRRTSVVYPVSDGKPMADNTIQFRWIAILKWNLDHQFADDPNVFVAGDHLIYPIEGDPTIRAAPDTYVAFGPAKGDRGCYKVFEEGGVFPQVVFEVWSPGNRAGEMETRRRFYETHGAEEFYLLYPEYVDIEGWTRRGDTLEKIDRMNGFVSPRLGIRFGIDDAGIRVFGSDGREFLDPIAIADERDRVTDERNRAIHERDLATYERDRASQERDRASQERDRLAKKLRDLGIDPDSI